MPSSFVHLHLHTEYSMLDGASRVGDVVGAVVADGQPAVGITDHGNMYGVLELYRAARDAGITPVVGMEAYFTDGSRFERPKRSEHEIYHLTLLAESNVGYHNLVQVSSAAYIEHSITHRLAPRSRWRQRLRRRSWISSWPPVWPQSAQTRRRRRRRTVTTIPSAPKHTSTTDAPGRRSSRLNAVATRTSSSFASR